MTESVSETLHGKASTPQLLVSVQSTTEATAAVTGGCEILDVKDPSRGSLGMAAVSVIEDVLGLGLSVGVPVSAALGEVCDWASDSSFHGGDGQPTAALSHLSFTKIGLANLIHEKNWSTRWQDTMSFLAQLLSPAADGPRRQWVAVIYADWQQAAAPSPDEVVDHVLSCGSSTENQIAGVLVDTWSKKSGRLLDSMTVEQLRKLGERVRKSNRFFAIAGRLQTHTLDALVPVHPDIIAVRSAVCRGEVRTSVVDAEAVRQLRTEINNTFAADATAKRSPENGSACSGLPVGAAHDQF
ncbi:MAG: hypothetical protein O3B13_19395 [Planctomycetota bacterium]|nr:hypothetical protein [Planctomycetota bacterium]MDA1165270.1 hypothetical protein [Planctomycetota bacterium]